MSIETNTYPRNPKNIYNYGKLLNADFSEYQYFNYKDL